jgi:plasmid stability protein
MVMSLQTITIQLPERLYSDVAKRARRMHRSVEEEVVAVVTEALPTINDLPSDLAEELEQLALLNDAELWQAAQTKLSEEEATQMQSLVWKQQRDGLTTREQSKAEKLLQRYNRTMLVRAKAAVLLKTRGLDISSLNPAPTP